jgi:phytoene desaturase
LNKRVIVIGAGFSGLSVSTNLAAAGYDVTLLEKNEGPGGRARQWIKDGYTFDMGPSWYWMPDVFEKYFALFGKKVSDYYHLYQLDPSYRVVFGKNDWWDVPAGREAALKFFETIEPGAYKRVGQFLDQAEYKYFKGMNDLVYKPSRSLLEFADLGLLKGIINMDVFNSIHDHIRKFVSHPRLIQLLEFPVLFLGAIPKNTPALYSLMNYADICLGTWFPKGGMHKIVEGMVQLAEEKGVKIKYRAAVKGFIFAGNKISGVETANDKYEADVVVAGADYHHVDQTLLPTEKRNYTSEYWDKRVMAPSSLIFYLGFDCKLPNLLHHNLFFDADFPKHAHEIYTEPQWPSDPLYYVSVTTATDASLAPPGHENVFILIPVAPGLDDTEATRQKYFELILDKLSSHCGFDIRPHITVKRSYAHRNFIEDYHAFKGNAYGLANTLMQTAIFKPSLKSKKISNLYFTGQLTVPGPGVPPSLISGQVVAKEVMKEHKI